MLFAIIIILFKTLIYIIFKHSTGCGFVDLAPFFEVLGFIGTQTAAYRTHIILVPLSVADFMSF